MNAKKFFTATIAGAITLFVLGFVLYELLLAGFFEANQGAGAEAYREPLLFTFLIAGELIWAGFVVWVLSTMNASTFGAGVKAGALIGLAVGFAVSLGLYGFSTLWTLTAAIVDPFVTAIRTGIAGGVIAAVLGRQTSPSM